MLYITHKKLHIQDFLYFNLLPVYTVFNNTAFNNKSFYFPHIFRKIRFFTMKHNFLYTNNILLKN